MARYALINADDLVVNHVEWDGVTLWNPPEGHTARLLADDESPTIDIATYNSRTDRFSDNGIFKNRVDRSISLTVEQKLEAVLNTLVTRSVLTQNEAKDIREATITVDGISIN